MKKVIDMEKYRKKEVIEIPNNDLIDVFLMYFKPQMEIEKQGETIEELEHGTYVAVIKKDELTNSDIIWNRVFAGREFKDINSIIATYIDVLIEQRDIDVAVETSQEDFEKSIWDAIEKASEDQVD